MEQVLSKTSALAFSKQFVGFEVCSNIVLYDFIVPLIFVNSFFILIDAIAG